MFFLYAAPGSPLKKHNKSGRIKSDKELRIILEKNLMKNYILGN